MLSGQLKNSKSCSASFFCSCPYSFSKISKQAFSCSLTTFSIWHSYSCENLAKISFFVLFAWTTRKSSLSHSKQRQNGSFPVTSVFGVSLRVAWRRMCPNSVYHSDNIIELRFLNKTPLNSKFREAIKRERKVIGFFEPPLAHDYHFVSMTFFCKIRFNWFLTIKCLRTTENINTYKFI